MLVLRDGKPDRDRRRIDAPHQVNAPGRSGRAHPRHRTKQQKHPREETMVKLSNSLLRPSRRTVLKGVGAGVAASAISAPWVARAAGTIKIGVVTPTTGPLANFGA